MAKFKTSLLQNFKTYFLKNPVQDISYNQDIINAKNSKESYSFTLDEFEKISNKMMQGEKIDFEKNKTYN